MTIKQTIRNHLETLPKNTRIHAYNLWQSLFQYGIARNSVTRVLSELAKEGSVQKSTVMKGRNAEWVKN